MNCPVLTWFQPVYCRRAGKPETNLSGHFQNSVAAEVTRLKLKTEREKPEPPYVGCVALNLLRPSIQFLRHDKIVYDEAARNYF
jgi:hypothetical protein